MGYVCFESRSWRKEITVWMYSFFGVYALFCRLADKADIASLLSEAINRAENYKESSQLEIVMNEFRKHMMSAIFFANTFHDICRCPGV